jgi:hypothetical protein
MNVPGRLRRLIHGWSANLVQMLLGLTQQLLLIPAFLHFWTSDRLAAWLAIYAAGSLVVIADAGLQLRAINRFLVQVLRRLRRAHGKLLLRHDARGGVGSLAGSGYAVVPADRGSRISRDADV